MLEPYAEKVKQSGETHCVSLNANDTAKWKEVFYPQLSTMLDDTTYFMHPTDLNPRYGIGIDGQFYSDEYFNCMFRLYLLSIIDLDLSRLDRAYVYSCIRFLYEETYQFRNQGRNTLVSSLSSKKLTEWLIDYWVYLSKPGLISDSDYYCSTKIDPCKGIGQDGKFTNSALLHFLYGCAQYLSHSANVVVPVWKLLFIYYPSIACPEGTAGSKPNDLEYCQKISEKMGKYLFAYSGGKVIAQGQFVNANRAITSLTRSGNSYYIGLNDAKPELDEYASTHAGKPEQDIIMTFARFDNIPRSYFGLALPSSRYCTIALAHQQLPSIQNPTPEGGGCIHELLHVLQHWGGKFGVAGVNPDKMGDYGYQSGQDIQFYQDILGCKVVKPGTSEKVGITDPVWNNPPHIHGV